MKQRKKSFGMRISAFVLSFAMVCTLLAGVNVVAFAADDLDDTVSVQKFYFDATKGGNGEHVYTVDEKEISYYKGLSAWNDEGEAWKAPLMSNTPVLRLCNPNNGEHFWTADVGEAFARLLDGWNQEGEVAFYSDDNMGVPVHRLWNGSEGPGSHHYTTDEADYIGCLLAGWQDDGVGFFGVKEEEPTTKALSAAQVGSDKIMVSSEDGFTGLESFTVSHGDLVDELAGAPEYDEDLDVYTITLANPIEDATYTVSCEGFKDATFEGEEQGEKVMTAEQSGAKTIEVELSEEAEGTETFTVMKGATVQALAADPEFSYDMKTVTLTLVNSISEDEYTVVCSDEEYDPATFTGETAVLTEVELSPQLINITGTTNYTATVTAYDQFGSEFVVDNWDNIVVVNGKYNNDWNPATGTFTIDAKDVDVEAGVTQATVSFVKGVFIDKATATYSSASAPAFVTVSDIQMTDAEKLANQTGRIDVDDLHNATAGSYFFYVNVVDQYGNAMTDANALNQMVKGSYLVVKGVSILEPCTPNAPFTTDGDGNVIMNVTTNSAKAGEGQISLIPLANTEGGDTATATISENEKIDTITVSKALDNLQIGTPVPVLVTATNNYGEVIDMDKEITNVDALTDTKEAVITYKGGSANSTADTAKATLTNGTWTYMLKVFSIAATNSPVIAITTGLHPQQYQFTPDNQAKVAGIYGLNTTKGNAAVKTTVPFKSNTGSAITNIDNPLNVILKDQYGKPYTTKPNPDSFVGTITADGKTTKAWTANQIVYTIAETGTHKALAADKDDGIVYKAGNDGSKALTEKFIITAWQVDGTGLAAGDKVTNHATQIDTYSFDVTVAGKEYVTYTYAFVDPATQLEKDVLYTGLAGVDKAVLMVYGIDASGNAILLNGDAKLEVDVTPVTTGTSTAVNTGAAILANGLVTTTATTAGDEEGYVTVDIWYDDDYVDTTMIELSNKAPEAELISATMTVNGTTVPYDLSDGIELTANANTKIVLTKNATYDGKDVITITDVSGVVYTITTLDQYGHSCIDKAVYGGTTLTNGNAVIVNAAGVATLVVKAGKQSVNVTIKAAVQV